MRIVRWALLGALLAMGGAARADAPPLKGFWRILVKPKARWVLYDTIEKDTKRRKRIVVETYDVRKVGGADVARLRWTLVGPKGEKQDWGSSDSGRYTQVAVTDAGLYILSDDMDDAKIAEALKKKPSRSDPPKPYKGTKQNEGRFLKVDGDTVCVGYEPLPGDGDCDDTCFGTMCLTATRGVTRLDGTWAPDNSIFESE